MPRVPSKADIPGHHSIGTIYSRRFVPKDYASDLAFYVVEDERLARLLRADERRRAATIEMRLIEMESMADDDLVTRFYGGEKVPVAEERAWCQRALAESMLAYDKDTVAIYEEVRAR